MINLLAFLTKIGRISKDPIHWRRGALGLPPRCVPRSPPGRPSSRGAPVARVAPRSRTQENHRRPRRDEGEEARREMRMGPVARDARRRVSRWPTAVADVTFTPPTIDSKNPLPQSSLGTSMRDKRPPHEHEVRHVKPRTPPRGSPSPSRSSPRRSPPPAVLAGAILVWTTYTTAPVHPGLWVGLAGWSALAVWAVVPWPWRDRSAR